MNEDFDHQLRRALRPVEAPEGFAERLLQRLPEQEPVRSPKVVPLPLPPAPLAVKSPPRRKTYGLPAALAASLVGAVLLGQQMAEHRMAREQAEGLAASEELMRALRVTSQKLDMAYSAVNREENPS